MKTGTGQSKYRNLTLFHVVWSGPCKSLLDCNVFNEQNQRKMHLSYLLSFFTDRNDPFIYRKIPKISPRAYIFQRPFLRDLFFLGGGGRGEDLIFGGAYVRRKICVSKSIGLTWSGKEIYHFRFVLLCIRGQIPSTRGIYSEGWFNGGFFALPFWGAYFRNFTVPEKGTTFRRIIPV